MSSQHRLFALEDRQEDCKRLGEGVDPGHPCLLRHPGHCGDGMAKAAGDKEGLKNTLIQAIEEKAGHLEYRAGRDNMYDELERLLPEKHYHVVLSVIDRGYFRLDDEPIADQIAKELWDFSQHIDNLVGDKHRKLAKKYPEWFNANIKLKVRLTHPLNRSPSEHRPQKAKIQQ